MKFVIKPFKSKLFYVAHVIKPLDLCILSKNCMYPFYTNLKIKGAYFAKHH